MDLNKKERRLDFIEDLKKICYKYDVSLSFNEHDYVITLIDKKWGLDVLTEDEEDWLDQIDFEEE